MYGILVIGTIFLILTGYGVTGGYLAAKRDTEWHQALVFSYFWPIILVKEWRNGKKNTM